jgi:hypothetical protein
MNGSTSRELCSQRENELCAREFERDNMEKPWWEGSSGRDHPRGIGREGRSKTSRHWEPPHQRQRAKRLLWGHRETFCALSSGLQIQQCSRSRLCSQNCDPTHISHLPVSVDANTSRACMCTRTPGLNRRMPTCSPGMMREGKHAKQTR